MASELPRRVGRRPEGNPEAGHGVGTPALRTEEGPDRFGRGHRSPVRDEADPACGGRWDRGPRRHPTWIRRDLLGRGEAGGSRSSRIRERRGPRDGSDLPRGPHDRSPLVQNRGGEDREMGSGRPGGFAQSHARAIQGLDRAGRFLLRGPERSEEHTSELQSRQYLVCRLLLEKKKKMKNTLLNRIQSK